MFWIQWLSLSRFMWLLIRIKIRMRLRSTKRVLLFILGGFYGLYFLIGTIALLVLILDFFTQFPAHLHVNLKNLLFIIIRLCIFLLLYQSSNVHSINIH